MSVEVRSLTGPDLDAALDDVARLRITVFREWPYIYDGDLEYERRYLSAYGTSAAAIVVGAFDSGRLVGASTGMPMQDHDAALTAALAGAGLDPAQTFYCAESILLAPYRGQGLGHAFFDLREDHARALGFRKSAFCGVIRPESHPARPADYRPLDRFWRKRGYAPLAGCVASYAWRDLGASDETAKPMQFWLRDL